MDFENLAWFKSAPASEFGKGPYAILIAEDRVELDSSLDHLHSLGFRHIFILAPNEIEVPPAAPTATAVQHIIRHPSRSPGATEAIVNALIEKVPGQWIHYCYNGEYLFFPFCEDRTVGELVTWVMEERREAVLTLCDRLVCWRSYPTFQRRRSG